MDSVTCHVQERDGRYVETCVASLEQARTFIDDAVQALGDRFSFAQAWENTSLGRRIDFTRSDGWSAL